MKTFKVVVKDDVHMKVKKISQLTELPMLTIVNYMIDDFSVTAAMNKDRVRWQELRRPQSKGVKSLGLNFEVHRKLKAISELTGVPMPTIVKYMVDDFSVTAAMEKDRIRLQELELQEQALSEGRKFYMGEKCVHGHDGRRYTKSGRCVACVKLRFRRRVR